LGSLNKSAVVQVEKRKSNRTTLEDKPIKALKREAAQNRRFSTLDLSCASISFLETHTWQKLQERQ
jgi:hypothetical protein